MYKRKAIVAIVGNIDRSADQSRPTVHQHNIRHLWNKFGLKQ